MSDSLDKLVRSCSEAEWSEVVDRCVRRFGPNWMLTFPFGGWQPIWGQFINEIRREKKIA